MLFTQFISSAQTNNQLIINNNNINNTNNINNKNYNNQKNEYNNNRKNNDYKNNEDNKTEETGLTEIIIAKHRNGATGEVNLAFEKNYSRFSDLAHIGPDGTSDGIRDIRS